MSSGVSGGPKQLRRLSSAESGIGKASGCMGGISKLALVFSHGQFGGLLAHVEPHGWPECEPKPAAEALCFPRCFMTIQAQL